MYADDITTSSVVMAAVGLLLELEFCTANMDKQSNTDRETPQ